MAVIWMCTVYFFLYRISEIILIYQSKEIALKSWQESVPFCNELCLARPWTESTNATREKKEYIFIFKNGKEAGIFYQNIQVHDLCYKKVFCIKSIPDIYIHNSRFGIIMQYLKVHQLFYYYMMNESLFIQ